MHSLVGKKKNDLLKANWAHRKIPTGNQLVPNCNSGSVSADWNCMLNICCATNNEINVTSLTQWDSLTKAIPMQVEVEIEIPSVVDIQIIQHLPVFMAILIQTPCYPRSSFLFFIVTIGIYNAFTLTSLFCSSWYFVSLQIIFACNWWGHLTSIIVSKICSEFYHPIYWFSAE